MPEMLEPLVTGALPGWMFALSILSVAITILTFIFLLR